MQGFGGKAGIGGKAGVGGGPSNGNAHSFARSFNGTSQALQSASNVDFSAATTVSIGLWLNETTFSCTDCTLLETSANHNGVAGAIFVDVDSNGSPGGSCSSGSFYFAEQAFTGVTIFALNSTPSAGAWHYILIIMDSATTGTGWKADVDGSSAALTQCSTATTTNGFTAQILNLMSRNSASLWNGGSIAEVAIWGADESSNAATLYNSGNGTLAMNVDSGNLLFYWHLCGSASPEPAATGSINLNLTGTPTQVTGPGLLNCP